MGKIILDGFRVQVILDWWVAIGPAQAFYARAVSEAEKCLCLAGGNATDAQDAGALFP